MVEATSMPIIQKAVNVIYDMSEDTKIRELARMREKALHDEASALRQAWEEGIAEGLSQSLGVTIDVAKGIAIDSISVFKKVKKEGNAEERNEMIEKMRAMGCSEELINANFPSD